MVVTTVFAEQELSSDTSNRHGIIMKILMVVFPINSIGGILHSTEDLIAGFQEIGHTVDLVQLMWQEKMPRARTTTDSVAARCTQGVLYPYEQEAGWIWPEGKRIPYKGKENIKRWHQYASRYDLLFWQTPVPTVQKSNYGNSDWVHLYDVDVPQLAHIHDAHFASRYPFMHLIADNLEGVGCVNEAAYNAFCLDVPKVLTCSPEPIPDYLSVPLYEYRKKGFLSCQTFKRWKHVDDLVRAIPHIPTPERRQMDMVVAGTGIEARYMMSKDKCKDIYFDEHGRKIWDVALRAGMQYSGWFIPPAERDKLLQDLRTQIDPSWNHSFAEHGGHWNRVTAEAIINGTIPLATDIGITGREDGNGTVFKADKNYIRIPWNATPKEYAGIIEHANNLSPQEAMDIQDAGWQIVRFWERKYVAQQFIDLLHGKPSGMLNRIDIAVPPKSVYTDGDAMFEKYFHG